MEKGQTIEYTKQFMFGKTSEVSATIVAIIPDPSIMGVEKILLDNGDSMRVSNCDGKFFVID